MTSKVIGWMNLIRWVTITIVIAGSQTTSSAQVNGLPHTLQNFQYQSIPEIVLPFVSDEGTVKHYRSSSIAGHNRQLDLSPANSGNWHRYNKHYYTWVLKIKIDKAASIGAVISNVNLYDGESLFVFNDQSLNGPFKRSNLPGAHILPINYMSGNEFVIEFNVPVANSMRGSFVLETISITSKEHNAALQNKKSNGSCYPCVNGNFWTTIANSIVRIVSFRENETITCTGTLVNNTARDAKPYILTANHCLTDQDDVDRTIFAFNYGDINCDGNPSVELGSMIGGKLRASSYKHDFSLIELEHQVPLSFQPYYAGWEISSRSPKQVSCIHHPQSSEKEVSIRHEGLTTSSYYVDGADPREENAFWHVREWNIGVTQGGSSGAPLFNHDQRIIGTLSGGASRCGSPYNDFFQQLSKSWANETAPHKQLKFWLDPISSGETFIEGFNPLQGVHADCDTLSNQDIAEETRVHTFAGGKGFLTGCNQENIAAFAEKFVVSDTTLLTGIAFSAAELDVHADGGMTISVNVEEEGIPGKSVFEKFIPYSAMKYFSNYVEVHPAIQVAGRFYITYSPECDNTNQFAIEQTEWRKSKHNTALIKRSLTWQPISILHEEGFGSSLLISAFVCKFQKDNVPIEGVVQINLRPNPVNLELIGSISGHRSLNYSVDIYDSQGKQKSVNVSIYRDHFIINVSQLGQGVYILRLIDGDRTYFKRFIKT